MKRLTTLLGLIGALAAVPEGAGSYTIAYTTFAPLNTAVFIANSDGSGERMLVPDAKFDSNPSFSPDGRWVVFSSRRNGSVDLYRVRIDGTQLQRLTHHVAFDDQAVVAPDGRHVAFVSSRSGQADIWLMDLQTRRLRNLTTHAGGDYRPAFSPDGQWIAFTSDRDSDGARAHTGFDFAPLQRTQIYVMRDDGSAVRRVTQGDTTIGGASWAPDGRSIAFYEATPQDWLYLGRSFTAPLVASQIARVDVSTGARTLLTSGAGRKLTPQWLPDGRIAYLRSDTEERPGQGYRRADYWSEGIRFVDDSEGPAGVFTGVRWSSDGKQIVFHRAVDREPPAVARVFSQDPAFSLVRTGAFPSFSPDGRQVVHTNGAFPVAGPADSRRSPALFVTNIEGSTRRVLFQKDATPVSGPSWSPTGDRIAFGLGLSQPGHGRFGPAQVAVVSPDGTGFRRVTPDDGGNYHFPDWSPDGKRIVLRIATARTRGLAILNVDSGRLTPLTADNGMDNLPKWSPKGDRIVFTSNRDGDWELYSVRPDGTGLKRLTHTPGNDAHAAWSADGRWLAFSSARGGFKDEMARGGGGQTATDIFVMRADGRDVRRLTDDAAEEGTVAFAWK